MELDYNEQQKLEKDLASFLKRGVRAGRRFIIREGNPAPYYGDSNPMLIEDRKKRLLLVVDSRRNPWSRNAFGYFAYVRDAKKI